jgi:hypothetical protein
MKSRDAIALHPVANKLLKPIIGESASKTLAKLTGEVCINFEGRIPMVGNADLAIERDASLVFPRRHLGARDGPAMSLLISIGATGTVELLMPFLKHWQQEPLCMARILCPQRPIHRFSANDFL